MLNIADKLDFYFKNKQNVLFEGKQGIGKSSLILDCFNRNTKHWLYFSAATMDPWVDFVGIPKEKVDADGKAYIDLIRPKAISDDNIEAIFFDEFNRAPKKVRNALMELIQFKSINGRKFPNLKIIWAAINPDDVDDDRFQFDVEKLDPAQKDRFQIIIKLPYQLDIAYFSNKYGEHTAQSVNEWWSSLTKDAQNMVSPRRVDYALELVRMGGDIEDCLPSQANLKDFKRRMKDIPLQSRLNDIYARKDAKAASDIVNSTKDMSLYLSFLEAMPDEKLKFFVDQFEPEMLQLTYKKGGRISTFIHTHKDTYLKGSQKEIVRNFDLDKLHEIVKVRTTNNSKIDLVLKQKLNDGNPPLDDNNTLSAIAECLRYKDSRKEKRYDLMHMLFNSFSKKRLSDLVKQDQFYKILNVLILDVGLDSFDQIASDICPAPVKKLIEQNAQGRLLV